MLDDTTKERIAFGKKLKEAREAANLSLRELAAASGVDHSNIAQIEKAERDPQLSTIIELAKALGISPTALF
jgi:transcriptional regulator with XRE-family HTH domain